MLDITFQTLNFLGAKRPLQRTCQPSVVPMYVCLKTVRMNSMTGIFPIVSGSWLFFLYISRSTAACLRKYLPYVIICKNHVHVIWWSDLFLPNGWYEKYDRGYKRLRKKGVMKNMTGVIRGYEKKGCFEW